MVKVTVFLEKLTDLKDTDGPLNKPDPYVVMTLIKDTFGPMDKKYGKQTSSIKQGTFNPTYGETFEFTDVPSLEKLALHCKVWDQDVGLDDGMGSTTIQLEHHLTPGQFNSFSEKLNWSGKGMIKKAISGAPTIHLKVKYEN